ncbi:MAG: 4-hydroxy-3-methylbut-2-enyl diphosphate reductase [Candidatus Krumholzibacteria bacterium]|nr:4-hydroxy-3-methylbut-2-enyl diphosphate reductase [Candidatus Krumholzibacteria bacterium]
MKRKLEVIRSPYTGYCFGVKRAMRLIEEGLKEHGRKIYTIGDVIHNPQAVERLKSRGVKPVSSLSEIEPGATLIIRAHGVHPDLMLEARKRRIQFIDTTCPFVQRSQKYARQLSDESYQVIIIGDSHHPEVQSISGHARENAIIINTVEEAEKLDRIEKVGIVIQTTFSHDKAMMIIETLGKKTDDIRVFDTICQATVLRREATLKLAESVDLMLVVGGRGSSNTRRLFQMCVDAGIPAKFIEAAEEIEDTWFNGCRMVGLTTGTSTPDWIIEKVLERMEEISSLHETKDD